MSRRLQSVPYADWLTAGKTGVPIPEPVIVDRAPTGQRRRRLFDHEEAVRRYHGGESQAALAREFGVTQGAISQAIKRLTDPEWKRRFNEYHRVMQRATRRTAMCGNCGKTIWEPRGSAQIRVSTGLCTRCLGLERAKGVREEALLCHDCGEWKPDREFPMRRSNKARRLRAPQCRPCQTIARQSYRERHKLPCVHCGAPALPASEKGPRGVGPPRCRPCYSAQQHGRLDQRIAELAEAAA